MTHFATFEIAYYTPLESYTSRCIMSYNLVEWMNKWSTCKYFITSKLFKFFSQKKMLFPEAVCNTNKLCVVAKGHSLCMTTHDAAHLNLLAAKALVEVELESIFLKLSRVRLEAVSYHTLSNNNTNTPQKPAPKTTVR